MARYQVDPLLGRAGMATVDRVTDDVATERLMALKRLARTGIDGLTPQGQGGTTARAEIRRPGHVR
jgi:hypothetical protein